MNLLASMRYLVALDQHRHFGRAAKACHITQPALSNAMRALEAEFKVVIVKRGRSYAGLTPEGEQVLAAAQRMLHEHSVLTQELDGTASRPRVCNAASYAAASKRGKMRWITGVTCSGQALISIFAPVVNKVN